MDTVPVIILLDQNIIVKNRIKDIFADREIKIFEAFSRQDVLKIMSQNNGRIDLIVSEIEIDPENGFDGINLIKLIKMKRSSIPVVILTNISKKDVITRCLIEGAADYILKPFEDDYLKSKLLKYINIETLSELTVIKFNLKSLLESEIYKARKGHYNFSLLMNRFGSSSKEDYYLDQYSFYNFSELIYSEMKSLFWESDLYIQHGFHSHLGLFPFCDDTHTSIIMRKVTAKFRELQQKEPHISNYTMRSVFSTFPQDGEGSSELLEALSMKEKAEQETSKL